MKKDKNDVLNLFNGVSLGRVALDRAKVKYGNYYSSEVDKFCKSISRKNYPDTFELGDICNWRSWGIDFSKIGLILAGFPCQAWSVAGKQEGDNDPRGELVHFLIEIWDHIKKLNPDVKVVFENVKMKITYIEYINTLFGMEPIEIDSALVSAQSRHRLYWTDIPGIKQPKDKKIFLKDIIGWSRSTRYRCNKTGKVYSHKGPNRTMFVEQRGRTNGKANTVTTGSHCGSFSSKNFIVSDFYLSPGWIKWWNKNIRLRLDKRFSFIVNQEEKAICLTARQYANWGGNFVCKSNRTAKRYKNKKSVTVKVGDIRKLSPVECELLQTIPKNYTYGVSDAQRYKMIGNGWTVDVVAHILKNLKRCL